MAYSLATSYMGEALLSGFNWFDGADPNHGFVNYQSRASAEAKGLFSVNGKTGSVRLGVDSDNVYPLDQGRPSIRLESKDSYNHGLFVADFLHMPPSQCGLWPAFWAYGPGWPDGGEVDIIEGANTAYRNTISAHTAEGCTVSETLQSNALGALQKSACSVGSDNVGCGYYSPPGDVSAYGDGFNAVNGGVYAMEWAENAIKIWHFARGSIPEDITQKNPDPSNWGNPTASFGGSSCDVDKYFKNMNLVININFCGDWAGGVWGKTDSCNTYASTCNEYVASNPQAFANAYWDIRFIDAYQKGESSSGNSGISSPSEPTTTTTMTTTTTTTVRANSAGGVQPGDNNNTPSANKPYGNSTSTRHPAPFIPNPSPLPAAPVPANPGSVGNSTYLGCYGSSTGFETFRKVKESEDMTVDMCVKLCERSMFAGVFEKQCFCADTLDADTRAANGNDGVCDHACPGDDGQMCGGIARRIGAVSNTTAPASSSKDIDSEGHGGSANGTALPTASASVKDNERFGVSEMNTTIITKTRTSSVTTSGDSVSSKVNSTTTAVSVAASTSTSREDETTTMSVAASSSDSREGEATTMYTAASPSTSSDNVNDKFNVDSNTTVPSNEKYPAALDSNSTSLSATPKLRHSNITAINIMNTPSRRAHLTRRIPNNILLTVYGFVKQEKPPPPPPPMAPGASVTFSFTDVVTAYKTVVPVKATNPPHHGKYIIDGEPAGSDATPTASASDDKIKGDMGGAYKESHATEEESHHRSHPAVATKVIIEDCGCEEGQTSTVEAIHAHTRVIRPPAETTPCTETLVEPPPHPPPSIKTITSESAPSQPTAPLVVTAGAAGGAVGELRYTFVLGLAVLAVAVLL